MKKCLLIAMAGVMALGASAQSKNGTVTNGELMVEDFEGTAPEIFTYMPQTAAADRWQEIHKGDAGVKDKDGSKMVWGLNAWEHRKAAGIDVEGKSWSSDAVCVILKVTLPEGKSLADYDGVTVDFYNYDPAITTANQFHKIFWWKEKQDNWDDNRAEGYKEDFTEDETISDGLKHEIHSVMDDWADGKGWGCIMFDPAEYTGSFYFGYIVQANEDGFYLDNIRLTGAKGESIVNNIAADKADKVYGTKGGIRVLANGEATVYNLNGMKVAESSINGNSLLEVASGYYVVTVNGIAHKVLVK